MTKIIGFDEDPFPDSITYGWEGGGAFQTVITEAKSGWESRNQDWDRELHSYDVTQENRTKAETSTLINFFKARKGRAYGFPFKDHADFEITGQTIGTGDGTTLAFQIFKRYSSGGRNHDRTILKPIASTATVLVSTRTQGGATVSETTGIVTLSSVPPTGDPVIITCEFRVPVRFDVDKPTIENVAHQVFTWSNIPLVEIPLPTNEVDTDDALQGQTADVATFVQVQALSPDDCLQGQTADGTSFP